MKTLKQLVEALTPIDPPIPHEKYHAISKKFADELHSKTGLKYSNVGSAYHSADSKGHTVHHLISDKTKSEYNKKYGGGINHHVKIYAKDGKPTHITSVARRVKSDGYGSWENSDHDYHDKEVKTLDHAADHFKEQLKSGEALPVKDHADKIFHPKLYQSRLDYQASLKKK